MLNRKICVVTGTRAEYGLLYWLMKEIELDRQLQLQLLVTGMHLSPEFGLTYQAIEADGFVIDEKVEMLLSSDTPVGITKSIGLGVIGFADALDRLKPDIMVVLGDRYEILAAVEAAMVFNIPVAHIHGGETTEGAIDEGIRHSITKMAHLHFVSAAPYQKRVIQLGEDPKRVFCFGSPGWDSIRNLKLLTLSELEESIGFNLGAKFFLVTYHPVTTNLNAAEYEIGELFAALGKYPEYKILMTKSNADTGGRIIAQMMGSFMEEYPDRVLLIDSLGTFRYLNALRLCAGVIGNSSSGLLEAPLLQKATVNIGDRQKGRLRLENVIDCAVDKMSIVEGIRAAISEEFQIKLKSMNGIAKQENVSRKIKDILKEYPLARIIQKHFYDL